MVMEPPASLAWSKTRHNVLRDSVVDESSHITSRWRTSGVTHPQKTQQDELIDCKQCDFKHCHDQQLDRAGFTQHGSE